MVDVASIILWFIAGFIAGAVAILWWGAWLSGKEQNNDKRSTRDP